jgi:hypothetical protein
MVASVVFAVHPNKLGELSVADQPAGTSTKLNRTRSKKVELRVSVSGAVTVPPFDATRSGDVGAPSPKDPSGPMRPTARSGSGAPSGSVEVAQLRFPRYRSDSRTSLGVASGRVAL